MSLFLKKIANFETLKRVLRKSPRVIAARLWQEIKREAARYIAPHQAKRFNLKRLLKATKTSSLNQLWNQLASLPFVANYAHRNLNLIQAAFPGHADWIFQKAQQAEQHNVALLGTGLIHLGDAIDWHKDYKTGIRWDNQYCHDIEYTNLEKPSDVKIPWEISRMQWLIPLGQAYLLTQDERYASTVKNILLDWIEHNPYANSVNWSCTMEVALRIIVWTWFFHVFKFAPSWQDSAFQEKFLIALYLHGDFTRKNLEQSDINGNHFTADAAGLVFAGLFFRSSSKAQQWLKIGWNILTQEIELQIGDDGVDYEASIAYHRLVCELFFLPALYREKCGESVPESYLTLLKKMAGFTKAYSRPDGSAPLLGDADDARVLPFGDQALNDHRYLISWIENEWIGDTESYWLYGEKILEKPKKAKFPQKTAAFVTSGYYIMANAHDHIFIDCAPIGLGGLGGHGHNDCLSFEAALDGECLITDSGAYLYTANYKERNYFRSTAAHNTPQIDAEEINRFQSPYHLWTLHNDAKPIVLAWNPGNTKDYFSGTHTGYHRLKDPVHIKREMTLMHEEHQLIVKDEFTAKMPHTFKIPLHLAPGVRAEKQHDRIVLFKNGKTFDLFWNDRKIWRTTITDDRISPSYGVIEKSQTIHWETIAIHCILEIILKPQRFPKSL